MGSVYSADSVRKAEQPLLQTLPDGELMQRAAYGLYCHICEELRLHTGRLYGNRVLLLVGAGNNGGDTLWCGTFLRHRGIAVTALLLYPEHTHSAGLAAFRAAYGDIITVDDDSVGSLVTCSPGVSAAISRSTCAIDGIVGIGGRGALREPAASIVAALHAQGTPIISVDIPSGVDSDTGVIHEPHVVPVATVTFGALKPCHVLAKSTCGTVHLVDIGLDFTNGTSAFDVLNDARVGTQWPVPGVADNKYSTGVVGVYAGSATYPGAALLCIAGAWRATSAMVRYVGSASELILHHNPDVICVDTPNQAGRVDTWVVGPGIGVNDAAADRLEWILHQPQPLVIDADAITLISKHPELMKGRPHTAPTLVTPHEGEFLRLCATFSEVDDQLPANGADICQMGRPAAVAACRKVWKQHGINLSILLKGRATYIAGDAGIFAEDTGSSWAATPGSGDVLSGILGAVIAHGVTVGRSVEESAAMAVRVHSRAAELAAQGAPITASVLADYISEAIRNVRH